MKKYNITTRKRREADNEIVRFKEEMDVLISSEEFIEKFRVYIEDIAMYKRIKGIKYRRSTDYASIGILDQNDLMQEAYLAFLEAYDNIDWDEVNGEGAVLWGFLKKSTILKYETNVRAGKDGIRVPDRVMFARADSPKKSTGVEYDMVTKLFSRLEQAFSNNVIEVATSKYDTDLTGYFLEVHMDEVLDLTREGNRDYKKNERDIVRQLYGIDCVQKTYKELSEQYQIPEATLRQVKKRALNRLKSFDSKQKIAHFLHEYRISTKANIGKR